MGKKTEKVTHFRVTLRNYENYGDGDVPGAEDPGARQGHYTDAESPGEAAAIVADRLRERGDEEILRKFGLDIQEWGDGRLVGIALEVPQLTEAGGFYGEWDLLFLRVPRRAAVPLRRDGD